ncbi:MAG TPA: GntR family transcriptional regulator [Candidatus Polarisedimenticolaceae bacterium]|nr:GntR family transcriptional regulator [Candidatus Polarisedimenticolaceae bacterium]
MRALLIDFTSEEPVYGQIARQLREAIVSGALAPGRALAPVRTVASDLGVNLNTVARAYRLLQEEGFLEIAHRTRARVLGPPSAAPPDRVEPLRRDLRTALARLRQAGVPARELKNMLEAELAALGGRRRG